MKKINKFFFILRKFVFKLIDKVVGIKNVFVKWVEYFYDEVDDFIFVYGLVINFRLVFFVGSDVVEDIYWEVKEILWVEEEKELYLVIVKFELEDLVVGCNYFLENSKLKNNKDIRFDVNELF